MPGPAAGCQHALWGWAVCELMPFSHFGSVILTLQPRGLQHARLPWPSPSPGVCSNSCPLSQWGHPTISSSVVPFSSCLQPFPASGSFQMSWLFAQVAKVLELHFSISPSNEDSGLISSRIDWFDLLAVQGTLKSLLQYHSLRTSVPFFSRLILFRRCSFFE